MKKGYCENCNKLVEYHTKEKEDTFSIRGKEYTYNKLIGYCDNCNEEITANLLTDENLKRMDDKYREIENIIKIEEITQILRKYKIGKKPLSKLLGWGEVTLTRYINGDVPTKPYSDELYKILDDANYMEKILDKNKDNITEKAYNCAKEAIANLKGNSLKNNIENEIELIARYIILIGKEITPLALQKILYYAQGFYYAFFGDYLFKEDCEAWVHGPVYTSIYYKYCDYGSSNIPIDDDYYIEDIIDEDKKELLNVVIKYFGYYNGKALEKMTHYESPWIKARRGLPIDEKSNNIIEKTDISEYFNKVKEKYNMLNLLEIKKYSDEQFNRVISLYI